MLFLSLPTKHDWPWCPEYSQFIESLAQSAIKLVLKLNIDLNVWLSAVILNLTRFWHNQLRWNVSKRMRHPYRSTNNTRASISHILLNKTSAKWCEYKFNGILNDNCNKKCSLFTEHWLFIESNTCASRIQNEMFTTLNKVDDKCEN